MMDVTVIVTPVRIARSTLSQKLPERRSTWLLRRMSESTL